MVQFRIGSILAFGLVLLTLSLVGNPQRGLAAFPSSECTPDGVYRHCYSIAAETTTPNGGASQWQDANYNPDCSTTAFIIQDFWFVGSMAPDGRPQWSEFGHQSCFNSGGQGGQYWAIFMSAWNTSCNCRQSGYIMRQSVSSEQYHRYEIRTNGNGTHTFQIDSTQLYTGRAPGNTPTFTSGTVLQTGVEVTTKYNANVLPIWARVDTQMQVIPASCGCNNQYQAWNGVTSSVNDCGYTSGPSPDWCRRDSPLDGGAISPTWYAYYGH